MNERRKAYPNELFHKNAPDRRPDVVKNANKRLASRRVNSASDATQRIADRKIYVATQQDLNYLIDTILPNTNSTQRAILTGGPNGLAQFAHQAIQIIQNARKDDLRYRQSAEGKKKGLIQNPTMSQQGYPEYLGLTEEWWAKIASYAKNGFSYNKNTGSISGWGRT